MLSWESVIGLELSNTCLLDSRRSGFCRLSQYARNFASDFSLLGELSIFRFLLFPDSTLCPNHTADSEGRMWSGGLRGSASPIAAPAKAEKKKKRKDPQHHLEFDDSQPPSSPKAAAAASVDDGEVNQCLRQLGKRDPATRAKALVQLSGLTERRSAEEIASFLHVWVGAFERLAVDSDPRVRQLLGRNLELTVSRAAKHSLHYLPRIFPFWWLLCQDPVGSVSAAAVAAFRGVFPTPAKQARALGLCRDSFLRKFAPRLLTTATPASLAGNSAAAAGGTGGGGGDLDAGSKVAAEEAFDRVVAACFNGISDLCQLYSSAAIAASAASSVGDDGGSGDERLQQQQAKEQPAMEAPTTARQLVSALLSSGMQTELSLPGESFRKLFDPLFFPVSASADDSAQLSAWVAKFQKSKNSLVRQALYRCLRAAAASVRCFVSPMCIRVDLHCQHC